MSTGTQNLAYLPDHAVPPGEIILECISAMGISARELARRCGRSGKLISEIITGKAPIEPETALQLGRVLGISAAIWTNMEAAHRLHAARIAEDEALTMCYDWAAAFPLKELSQRGLVERRTEKPDQVRALLEFFGVGSVKACEERIADLLEVDFRTSEAFANDRQCLAAWLRIGETRATSIDTADYDRDAFLAALGRIRSLTREPIREALPQVERLCAEAGVAFVLEKPFPRMRASGVSRWLSPRKALIQQSLRHKSDDHLWFTFFHECAHILLHSRKTVFIDMAKGPGSAQPKQEAEANVWAADFLIPTAAMRSFVGTFGRSEAEVRRFASEIDIAPGIVVGQLQHSWGLPFSAMNKLKVFYEWSDS